MKLQYSRLPYTPAEYCELCKLVLIDVRRVCSFSGGSEWRSWVIGNGWTRVGGRFVDGGQICGEELPG